MSGGDYGKALAGQVRTICTAVALVSVDRVLHQMLDNSASKFGDRPAMHLVLRYLGPLTIGSRMTYKELQTEVNRCAAALYSLGVRKGDRVAIMLPNLPQFVISFYGAIKLGAIVVNTNPTYTRARSNTSLPMPAPKL